MSELRVDLDSLTPLVDRLRRLSEALSQQATTLESGCEAVPTVGDVRAAAVFGQDHYDWNQTRFEDLTAERLSATIAACRGSDDQIADRFTQTLGRVDRRV